MGFRLRWIAVANAGAEEACALLDFRRTGQLLPNDRYEVQDLPLGAALARHYMILDDAREDPNALRDPALAEASRRFELLAGFVYDAVSTTEAALWRNGRLVWRLTFEGADTSKLIVQGDPPAELASWRDTVEDEVDIPLLASTQLTGFVHDQDQSLAFERLERPAPAVQPGPRGWLSRLFGRS
jgi:hypothetical protein